MQSQRGEQFAQTHTAGKLSMGQGSNPRVLETIVLYHMKTESYRVLF